MRVQINGFDAFGRQVFRGDYIFKYLYDAAIEAQNIKEDYPVIVRIVIDAAL